MTRFVFALFLVTSLCTARAFTQQHTPGPEAQAVFDQALKLPYGDPGQMALLRKAIDLDPDFPEAQRRYTVAYLSAETAKMGTKEEKHGSYEKARDHLNEVYTRLSDEHPKLAVYPWVLGELWEYDDPNRAVAAYKRAIVVDPNFGPAYDQLATAAEEQGHLEESQTYEAKAHEVWPNDIDIWRHYIGSLAVFGDQSGLDRSAESAQQLAEKNPAAGVWMMSINADRSTDVTKRRAEYELILSKYPKQAGGYTLIPLFWIYIAADSIRALNLADAMRQVPATEKDGAQSSAKLWQPLYDYAKEIVNAQDLIVQNKNKEALKVLDVIKTPSGGDDHPLVLMKAKALAADGQALSAYNLLENDYAEKPSSETYPMLLEYAKKLGKSKAEAEAAVQAARIKLSKDPQPFTLTDYATGKPVSLSDYKGRVVLVNFWYPKCGPCRGEFPYLQMALEKYKNRGFAILAINGHAPEDEWVMPLIRGWHLGFTPLKATPEVIKEYGIHYYPNNFLYGTDGRIYPMPNPVRAYRLEELELQIEGLLAQASVTAVQQRQVGALQPVTMSMGCAAFAKLRTDDTAHHLQEMAYSNNASNLLLDEDPAAYKNACTYPF